MSNVHIRQIEDVNGDLVDLEYYHHQHAPEDVLGWPAPESVDSCVYCQECGERIFEVPLTRYGLLEADWSQLDAIERRERTEIETQGAQR